MASLIMRKKIILHYSNSTQRGPGVVVQNLKAGLAMLPSVDVYENRLDIDGFHGALQNISYIQSMDPSKTVYGPNIFVLPTEMTQLCTKAQKMIVPSQWVLEKYRKYDILDNTKIDVWPVGINTNLWTPNHDARPISCLVYYKNRTSDVLWQALRVLTDRNIPHEVFTYGSYTEDQLLQATKKHTFAILVTNTESQGMAYMQILSAGLPCFVFDMQTWSYQPNPTIQCPATSVPYFDERCGLKFKTALTNELVDWNFELFLESLHEYKPREFILDDFTLEECAYKYSKLLTE